MMERLTISAFRVPALPGVATMLLSAMTKPLFSPLPVAVAMTSPLLTELVKTSKLVVVAALVVAKPPGAVLVAGAPLLFKVPPVMIPPIVPVHAAPLGQHATCPAKSALQTALDMQQRLGAPRLAHERKLSGQPFDCLFSSSCAVPFCSD